jgi:hypothetical protein
MLRLEMRLTFTTTVTYDWIFNGVAHYLSQFDDCSMCSFSYLAKITIDKEGDFFWKVLPNSALNIPTGFGKTFTLYEARQAVKEVLRRAGVKFE